MRILFTYMGGSGHFVPLVPLAQAAIAAGHAVAFVAPPATVPQVQAAGFDTFVSEFPPSHASEREALHQRAYAISSVREREDLILSHGFAGLYARSQVGNVTRVCAEWKPDLIVRDEFDFGSAVAAERLGLPCATVLINLAGSMLRTALLSEPLNALRATHGLPPDPALAMLERDLVLCLFPVRFRDPAYPLPKTAVTIGPGRRPPGVTEALPEWVTTLPQRRTVYFSLGTEFNEERQDLFAPVIAGIRDLPLNLIVTVGRNLDPASFGPQPANVHVERYITQSLLLPRCDLVVTHGGSGTIMGALSAGVPLVVIPLGADQPQNAERCLALGVGLVVNAGDVTAGVIREAVEAGLTDPTYRAQAARCRDEIATLPGPDDAIALFERLSAE